MFFRSLIALSLLIPASALAGFEVSSSKRDSRKGDNYWAAGAALDSRMPTAWMVDPEQKNAGQWIQVDTPSGDIDKIEVVIGWDENENNFFDYARVKKARIEVWSTEMGKDDVPKLEHEVTFEDKRGWQMVDIPDAKVGGELGGGKVRMTILEVYDGKDYPNLAMSEFRVHLKEFPAETMMVKTLPENPVEGHDGSMLEDMKDSTFFATTDKTTSFELTAQGYQMSSVGLKSDAKGYARPKTIKVHANDLEAEHVLEDNGDWQWVLLPVVAGYTGSAWGTIRVEVVDTYEGEGVGINEVKLNAATIETI